MANKLLGEIEIDLCGDKYILKPEHRGILEIEDKAGCSLSMLLNKLIKAQAGYREVFAIVWGGLVGSGQAASVSEADIGNRILQTGWTNLLGPCGKLLGAAYSGKPIDDIDASSAEKGSEAKKKAE